MKSIWMLAQSDSGETDVITMEPAAPAKETSTQQDGANGTDTSTDPPKTSKPDMSFLIIMGVMLLFMYFFMLRGPKKKQQEHQKMVSSLKKNDRIRTIGGILGTVLDVKPDEIVIKIDEATNTKMRVIPSAVATVITEEKK